MDLGGLATGINGLMVMADGIDNVSFYDFQKLISPETSREDPQGLDAADDLGPNDGSVYLLTKGPRPVIGASITTIASTDIVDSIGYGSVPAGVTNVTLVSLSTNGPTPVSIAPDNVSRVNGDFTANSAAAWFGGKLDPGPGDASWRHG